MLNREALLFVCALPFVVVSCSDSSRESGSGDGATDENGAVPGAPDQGSTDSAGTDGSTDGSAETGDPVMPSTEYPTPDKLVALTFDDGPDPAATGAVLDKLETHQVPASFFLIGQKVNSAARPVLERAAALGCEFENHSHGYSSLTGLMQEEIEASVRDANDAIEQATGTRPVFFRPPNLATDALMFEVIDLPFVSGVVAGDFPAQYGGDPTVTAVTDAVLSQVQDGSIILMHDAQPELDPHPTPEALDTIIVELRKSGYEFVTLRQLFERRGIDPTSRRDSMWSRVPAN